MDYLNFSCTSQSIFSLENTPLVFNQVNKTDSTFDNENTPDEIADIVSDRVIEVIMKQFKATEKALNDKKN